MSMNPALDTEKNAFDYLRAQLGERAPQSLELVGCYNEKPIDGEGAVSLYSFELELGAGDDRCERKPMRHYVVVGETTPNYFPAYTFDADDAYSFHIGTRFMLEMRVSRVDDTEEPPGAREAVRNMIRAYVHSDVVSTEQLAGLFRFDETVFAVYRVEIDEQPVYVMGADCPPGFYTLTNYPPQTALRLHIGKLIRDEAQRLAGQEDKLTE